MTNAEEVSKMHFRRGRIGVVVFAIAAVAFGIAGWSIPSAICAFIAGRSLGEISYAAKINAISRRVQEIHNEIGQRVREQVEAFAAQYNEMQKNVNVAVHQSAAEACSAIAANDAEQSDPGVVFGDTDLGRRMSMKPGAGNAVALSPWGIKLDDDDDDDEE